MSDQKGKSAPAISPKQDTALVTRSRVPDGQPYGEYKQYLRFDFFYSCAYCTISEAEAQAIRFTIDHYEPQSLRPDLKVEYSNLMYACDTCNERKGSRCPTEAARAQGIRFFRPDFDVYRDHFEKSGIRLNGKTQTGEFSIEALDLNRQALRRLRELRTRLVECDALVAEGVLALRQFHIDQLPPGVKGRAAAAINRAALSANKISQNIDQILRDYAQSPLVDPDLESEERAEERKAKLKVLEAIFPGKWRASAKKSTKRKGKPGRSR